MTIVFDKQLQMSYNEHMTDDEFREVLENILDLAHSIGWTSAMVQTKNGDLTGLYIGTKAWIDSKTNSTTKPVH